MPSAATHAQPVGAKLESLYQREINVRMAAFVVDGAVVERKRNPGIGLELGGQMEPHAGSGRGKRQRILAVSGVPDRSPIDEAVKLVAFEDAAFDRLIETQLQQGRDAVVAADLAAVVAAS